MTVCGSRVMASSGAEMTAIRIASTKRICKTYQESVPRACRRHARLCCGRRGLARRNGNLERERRSSAWSVTRGVNAPAVHLDEMAHECEPESESAELARRAAVRLTESLPHVRQKR